VWTGRGLSGTSEPAGANRAKENLLFGAGNRPALRTLERGSRMRSRILATVALGGLILFLAVPLGSATQTPLTGSAEVFFSPNGGATEAIVRVIGSAKREVLVQAYNFTSVPIAKALLAAPKRGVKVEAVLDKSQRTQRYSSATFLTNAGIPVWIDSKHVIAHNKVILIDKQTVVTGSFNFTKAAEERNAENLLVIKGSGRVADSYLRNFESHKAHSEMLHLNASDRR